MAHPRRKLSPGELRELVRLACPRDWVEIGWLEGPHRLIVMLTVKGAFDRAVHVTIGRSKTLVAWITPVDGHQVEIPARPGESEGGVSLDALNLIRCAVGWLVGEDLPPWPDLFGDWEWDDPDYGMPLEGLIRPVAQFRGDCPTDETGDGGKATEGP